MYSWLFLSLCMCLYIIPDTTHGQTDNQLITAVYQAFTYAQREHERQKLIDEYYLRTGVDELNGKTSSGTATCHYQHSHMFRYMMRGAVTEESNSFVGIVAAQQLSKVLKLSYQELRANSVITNTFNDLFQNICQNRKPRCFPGARYRSIDGSCNNVMRPTWGMALRPSKRYQQPIYNDGISEPRTLSVTGKPLPSARLVSNVMHEVPVTGLLEQSNTVMVMVFGQLIDHDITETPILKGAKDADIRCCRLKQYHPYKLNDRPACFPIPIPKKDRRFNTCMNFIRSTPGCPDRCTLEVREQLNQLSSYLDAGFLYGANVEDHNRIRNYNNGLLTTTRRDFYGPQEDQNMCVRRTPSDYCMKSGDRRIHVIPTLTSIQVLFLREHNAFAKYLGSINPHWKDEKIYQETRKIIIALVQQITYREFLPVVLGLKTIAKFRLETTKRGFNTAYDPAVDATVSNAFATAAFRFGHTLIPSMIGLVDHKGGSSTRVTETTFNQPQTTLSFKGLANDWILRWEILMRSSKADRFIENAVRDELFLDDDGNAFDLAALNIQRGRDHGIPGYNAWRRWCGLSTAFHFISAPGGLVDMNKDVAARLARLYRHPDDIDLFPGAMSEELLPGAKVGPIFACIIGRQFHDFKFGDRFWYENAFPETGLTEEQLNSIKTTKLSTLVCRGLDDTLVQNDVFSIPSESNPQLPCKSLPRLNLNLWRDKYDAGRTNKNNINIPMDYGWKPPQSIHRSKSNTNIYGIKTPKHIH